MQYENDEKQGAGKPDPDLVLLERVLSDAADMVFPLSDEVQEATEEEIDRLMQMTAEVRKTTRRPKLRLLKFSAPSLALAASLFILVGAGLFFSMRTQGSPGILVAVALPSERGMVFRGGTTEPMSLSEPVTAGIAEGLGNEAQDAGIEMIRMEELPFGPDRAGGVGELIERGGNRPVLYVTEDETGRTLVLTVFEGKSGKSLAETRIESGDAAQVQREVSSVVAAWRRAGVL